MVDLNRLGHLPPWIAGAIIAVLTVSLIVGLPLARAAATRAARLARGEQAHAPARSKDKLAMFAALAPTVLVWLAVMGVSFIGLTGFASTAMQWHHWTNILVPLSLDGISISFGGWAFIAVRQGKHPGRSYKIVLAAATVSATLNFVHGKDTWSIWAGGYLAFLSLAGMAMFHEMLDQFMADYDQDIALKTRYPRFGRRWLWAPITTFKALRAWIVYPPAEGTRPTIHNALEHWRRIKQLDRDQRFETPNHTSERRHAKAGTDRYPPRSKAEATAKVAEHHFPAEGTGQVFNGANGPAYVVPAQRDIDDVKLPVATSDASEERLIELTKAQVNAIAEDLWIEFRTKGTDLSGSQLLQEFRSRHPHPRGLRWADYRRKAAQERHIHHDTPALPSDAKHNHRASSVTPPTDHRPLSTDGPHSPISTS